MSTPFDRLKRLAFDQAARTMGVDALWGSIPARVLFNQPSATEQRTGIDFMPDHPEMEYRVDDFPGLYDNVRDGDIEIITIGSAEFTVRQVTKAYDGDTIKAQLVPN
jgi:hypothetical protein